MVTGRLQSMLFIVKLFTGVTQPPEEMILHNIFMAPCHFLNACFSAINKHPTYLEAI